LEKYTDSLKFKNAALSEWRDEAMSSNTNEDTTESNYENKYLPYTSNGYIGISMISKQGLFASHFKSLNTLLGYNPLVSVYSDNLVKQEFSLVEFNNGLINKIQCYKIVSHKELY
jgi:hypothetical protein